MYFLHQIRTSGETVRDKGIASKETLDAALQSYHSYMGAYAYGREAGTDFVHCTITDNSGMRHVDDFWKAVAEPEPEVEQNEA